MDSPLAVGVDVSKIFGEGRASVTAIREATFLVRPGDRIAMAGPSGSGKSTILHLMAGLDVPTSGSIEWPGLGARTDLRPGLVGVSFQGPSLLPPLTVEENVALPLLLAGAEEDLARSQATEMIDALDLAPVATKLPEELSGGQAERAGVARALVGRPRLVLADEPTGQQDRATGGRLVDLLLRTTEALGAALIVATHDRSVAERFPIGWSIEDRRLVTGMVLRSG
jgi:ABC-type lipoprotein export system ATPase subunit